MMTDYLSAGAMLRIDQEFALLIRREAQLAMTRTIHKRGLPIVSSDFRPDRDRGQEHQRWPRGVALFFSGQPVIKRRTK